MASKNYIGAINCFEKNINLAPNDYSVLDNTSFALNQTNQVKYFLFRFNY